MARTMALLALMLLALPATAGEVHHDLYGDPLPKGALARLGTRRFRHDGYSVLGAAYSPNGSILATCGGDNLIRLWDAGTGKELRRLDGHINTPSNLAFSPHGKLLASGSEDNKVQLWDIATGKLLRTFKLEGASFSVIFMRDGKTLATSSADKRIRLWDVATGKSSRTLEGHTEGDILLVLSPDGKLLASAGCRDGTICLWDVATGKKVRECGRCLDKIHCLRFAPDGKTLATSGEKGAIQLWNVTTGAEVRRWKAYKGEVQSLIFQHDGRSLFSCDDGGTIREWESATGKERRRLGRAPLGAELSLSPDGKTLAVAGLKPVLHRWDLVGGKELSTPRGHESCVTFVRFKDEGKTLLSTADDGSARFWDVATAKERRREKAETLDEEGQALVALSPDGRSFAEASGETIALRNLTSGKRLATIEGVSNIDGLRFSPDGKLLATGFTNEIRLWDARTGKERCRVPGQWCVAFSADSRLLAASDALLQDKSSDGIHLWDAASGKEVRSISPSDKKSVLYPLCFSADGRMLAGWQHRTDEKDRERGALVVWEVITGRERFRLCVRDDVFYAAAFSPDGTMLAAGGEGQTVHLWDVRTGREQPSLHGDQAEIRALAFSKDGRHLASGGRNTTILIWSIAQPKSR